MITISSQRYIDDDVVAKKLVDRDFIVAVSPVFEIDGVAYRIVLDGHHSLAASKSAGVAADFVEHDVSNNGTIAVLNNGNIESFLEMNRIDSDYYNVETGADVW